MSTEEEIFQDSITPQNLKDNETISKLMKIYLDNLKNQKEITQEPTKLLDTNYLIDNMSINGKYDGIKKELFKIHLDEIYKVFENIENSDEIYNKYKEIYQILGISTDNLKIDFDVGNKVDSEYVTASMGFKSKKGTRAGFFFVNDIINKVNIDPMNADSFFKLDEGDDIDPMKPYTYTVKASMYKEVFRETILPLSHPVGFNWYFLRLLYLTLTDYFGLIETSTITGLSLSCDDGNTITKQKIVKKGYDSNDNAISLPIKPDILSQIYFGKPSSFFESTDQDNRDKTVIDFYAVNPHSNEEFGGKKQNGLRLVRDYDGRVTVYNRQNPIEYFDSVTQTHKDIWLELDKVELQDSRQGKLTLYKKKVLQQDNNRGYVDDVTVIHSIRFEEYSIFSLTEVKIRFSFKYGTPLSQGEDIEDKRIWEVATIKLDNKVIGQDKKFFEKINITSQELIANSTDYNGRVYDDREYNCTLNYEVDKRYKITTDDDSEYVKNIRPDRKSIKYIKESGAEGWTDNSENTVQQEDEKYTHDTWARLDPIAGVNPIHDFDKGINYQMSVDADLDSEYMGTLDHNNLYNTISTSSDYFVNHGEKIRRNEAYFAPTTYKDLADLGIAHINSNNVYDYNQTTDDTNSDILNKDEIVFNSITNKRILGGQGPNTPAIYERQNKDNITYIAKEYETQDYVILMTPAKYNAPVEDPIYHRSTLIDASGVNRGDFDGYNFIGEGRINTNADYEIATIGNLIISGYMDQEQGNEGLCINPHASIYILEDHNYDADPVNLLLNTFDCSTSNFWYGKLDTDDVNDDNVNTKGDYRTGGNSKYKTNTDEYGNGNGEDSFADESGSTDITYTPYLDHYNYTQTDWEIGADYKGYNLVIGEFPILGVKTVITDNVYKQDGERINVINTYIDMNKHDQVYAYNNFTNSTGNIGAWAMDQGLEIGGHIYEETGQFEIYQAVWNTHEYSADNIDVVREWSRYSDNVNFNGDERTPGSISSYKKNEDNKDSFATEANTTDITYAPYIDDFNFEQHDYELQDLEIGSFILKGIDKSAQETSSEDHTINMNRHPAMDYAPGYDWKADYEDNSHLNTFNTGDELGQELYICGEITYNYGEYLPLGGFADPVNLIKNTLNPMNITYYVSEGADDHGGFAAGNYWDENEKQVGLIYNTSTKEWESYIAGSKSEAHFVQENPSGPVSWGEDAPGERLEKTEFWITNRDYWEIEEQNFVVGDDNEVVYIGGKPKLILEPENTTMFWRATTGNHYAYPIYVDLMSTSENNQIGEGYIGGELTHDELVDAEVYKDIWTDAESISSVLAPTVIDDTNNVTQVIDEEENVKEDVWTNETNTTDITHAPSYDEFKLRNADSKIGEGMVIGGTTTGAEETNNNVFYIGGELIEIVDSIISMLSISSGKHTYTVLEVAETLVIGKGEIGDTYIKAKAVSYTDRGEESFMSIGSFDIFSDEDKWEIGVWKNDGDNNYTLLDDHNQAAAS